MRDVEGANEAGAVFYLSHTIAFLLAHLTDMSQCPGLQLLHLPLDLPSASLILAPGEQKVATILETGVRHLHVRGWERNPVRNQEPETSVKCLGVQSVAC